MPNLLRAFFPGILLIALHGCANSVTSNARMLEWVTPAVVAIANRTHSRATGFFISDQTLMTSAHVWNHAPLYYILIEGERDVLSLVEQSADHDLGVVRM